MDGLELGEGVGPPVGASLGAGVGPPVGASLGAELEVDHGCLPGSLRRFATPVPACPWGLATACGTLLAL